MTIDERMTRTEKLVAENSRAIANTEKLVAENSRQIDKLKGAIDALIIYNRKRDEALNKRLEIMSLSVDRVVRRIDRYIAAHGNGQNGN